MIVCAVALQLAPLLSTPTVVWAPVTDVPVPRDIRTWKVALRPSDVVVPEAVTRLPPPELSVPEDPSIVAGWGLPGGALAPQPWATCRNGAALLLLTTCIRTR